MSTEALGTALSGLRAAQQGLNIVSNNVANASTEGYTAKSISQQSAVAGDSGVGVRVGQITRFVDRALQRDYRTQLGLSSYYNTRQIYLSRLVSAQGSAEQEKNIGSQIGKLYQAFVQLSSAPDSTTAQQGLLTQAGNLVRSFNSASQLINDMRNEAQTTINEEVKTLNETLRQIAEFNNRISTLQAVGQSTAVLEDQRDSLIKNVASQMDVTYYTNGNGTLVLQTKGGQVLADTAARTLEFDNSVIIPSSNYPTSLTGLILKGAGTDTDTDLAAVNIGGKLGALISMRDKELPNYNAQLDELAHKLAMRFDDQNVRLFTNSSGVVPANVPTSYNGFAGTMQVNADILANPGLLQRGTSGPAVNAGSNTIIMNVVNYTFGRYRDAANTLNVAFNTDNVGYDQDIDFRIIGDPNTSIEQFARAMLDGQASDLNLVKTTADNETQYMQEVQKRLYDTSAVDTDYEMGKMIELQKNYSASAKMITALDQLFRDLLNAF